MSRATVALAVCISLVLTRLLGAHAHVSQDAAVASHHDHAAASIAFEFAADPGHAQAHDRHGEVDATSPDFTGKAANTLALALIAAVLVLATHLLSGGSVLLPAYRGPPFRRRPHLLPPSQAPPLAS
jgi:hypothetical protein